MDGPGTAPVALDPACWAFDDFNEAIANGLPIENWMPSDFDNYAMTNDLLQNPQPSAEETPQVLVCGNGQLEDPDLSLPLTHDILDLSLTHDTLLNFYTESDISAQNEADIDSSGISPYTPLTASSEFSFAGLSMWEASDLSPSAQAEPSPEACLEKEYNAASFAFSPLSSQPSESARRGDEARDQATAPTTKHCDQPTLSPAAIAPGQVMGVGQSRIPARIRRKTAKPEECPACPMRFPYQADLLKHIAARHKDIAQKHGVSTERPACQWCQKTFARKDHLLRHLTNKHARSKARGLRATGNGWGFKRDAGLE